jgi:hypothetical protein
MADFATNLNLILQSQSQKEATADALFDAMSIASYWGRDAQACAALTWGYYGGVFDDAGTPTRIANGTLALTDNATCYIRQDTTTGVIDFVTSAPSGWPGPVTGYTALYEVTTLSGLVTNWLDFREGGGGGTGGGTVADGSITNAKLADMANNTYKGRRTAGTGVPEDVSLANLKTDLGLTGTNSGDQTITLTGNVTGTGTGSFAATIASSAVTNAKLADMANATIKGRTTAGTGAPEDLTAAQTAAILGTNVKSTECIVVAVTDETTPIASGTAKITFRMPYAFTVTDVRASLTTAQATGTIFTVDVNESGTTIISTKLTIDNTEKTSTTAATPRVISDSSLADDAEMTVDVDQVGDGTATGLKVYLIGNRT